MQPIGLTIHQRLCVQYLVYGNITRLREQFNKQQWANQYMATDWDLFLPKNSYTNSTADNVPWETLREGETAPVFPHMTSNASSMELIKGTPYGNSLTVDFAKAALLGEGLGKDQHTDFLCVSFPVQTM